MAETRYPISRRQVENLKTQFREYVQRYISGHPSWRESVMLKDKHSWLVRKEALYLASELALDENATLLAEIAGLYHDIGRFEQFARYQTFVDMKSENHAELGAEVIREEKFFGDLDSETREMLIEVIALHNRASLPEELSRAVEFFTRLLRDADKIDIYRVVTEYYHREDRKRNQVIEYGLPDTPGISDEVYNDLKSGHIVSIHHLHNLNDFKMLQVGWVYDLNFAPSFRRVLERNYLEKIRKSLPESERMDEIFSIAFRVMKEKSGTSSIRSE
mgnify:CR=1 FL=1